MTLRSRLRAAAAVSLFLVLAGAGPTLGAEPSSDSIGRDDTAASWHGAWFHEAAFADPGACDPPADPANELCDHYVLTVDVEDAFWQSHDGRVIIGIVWPRARDDFDLYVFEIEGDDVWASTDDTGTDERVTIDEPVGGYEVRVVPVEVGNSGYLGWASLSSDVVSEEGSGGTSGGEAAGGSGHEGTSTTQGSGGDPVGSQVSTSGGAPTFAEAPYAARTFDSTPTPTDRQGAGVDQGEVAPSSPAPEPVLPEPAGEVPDTMFQVTPVEAAPTASSAARFPESAWIVLALGVLALALTGLAVFERHPEDRVARTERRPRVRPQRDAPAEGVSIAASSDGPRGGGLHLPRWG
jgi:hypothetical protein